MKISSALKAESTLKVTFGTEELTVVYRPSSVTIQDVEALKNDKNIARVADQIRQQVVRWDLTDEHNMLIPLTEPDPVDSASNVIDEHGKPVDGTVQIVPVPDPLHIIPISIMVKILVAIQMDGRPSAEA